MRHRSAGAAAVAALSLALSGCWFQPGFDARRAGQNPIESTLTAANVGHLAQAWSVSVGSTEVTDPAISVQSVHATAGRTLTTRLLGDGTPRWTDALLPGGWSDNFTYSGAVSVRDGKVLVPISVYRNFESGAGVHAYDAQTGAGGEIIAPTGLRSVTVAGATLTSTINEVYGSCAGCTVSHLYVTDLGDAARSWSTILDIGSSLPVTTTAVGDAMVFLGQNSALDAFTVAKPTACPEPAPGQPFCTPAWARTLGGAPTAPVLSEDARTVYVGDAAGGVWALNAADGTVLWRASTGGGSAGKIVATPTLGDGRLYVSTADGTVRVFDANGCGVPTCTPLWAASTGSPINTQAALAGRVLYVGSDDGSISAYRAGGCGAVLCVPVWKTATGSRITGAPAVGLGYLVVGTADGRLIAYHAT